MIIKETRFGLRWQVWAIGFTLGPVLLLWGFESLRAAFGLIFSPSLYGRDFLALYTQIRAVAAGQNSFESVSVLAFRYLGISSNLFPHPSPHSPAAAILFLVPFAWLDFRSAAAVWFALQIGCLLASIYLLGRLVNQRLMPVLVLGAAVVIASWSPISNDLIWANFNLVLLVGLVGMFLAARSGWATLAGALLGLDLLIKPVAWPLLLAFALKRDWRTVRAALAVDAVGLTITGLVVGFPRLWTYGTRILPQVTMLYQSALGNISLSAQVWHLLYGGTIAPCQPSACTVVELPVLFSERAAQIGAIFLPILLVGLFSAVILSALPLEWSLSLAVCLSVIINPISWEHYEVLLLIPVALVAKSLVARRGPAGQTILVALSLAVLFVLTWPRFARLAELLSGVTAISSEHPLSGLSTIIFTGPTLSVMVLGAVVAVYGRVADTDWPNRAITTPPLRRVEDDRTDPRVAWAESAGVETLRRMATVDHYNRWIFKRLAPHVGRRVLEVGCGIGNMTPFLLSAEQLTCVDVLPESVAEVCQAFAGDGRVRAMVADISAPPIQKLVDLGPFDTAVCINVLEHIREDRAALRHMHDLLRPGGRLLLFVPAGAYLYGPLDSALGHYRRYSPDPLRDIVEEAGFEVLELGYLNAAGIPGWFVSSRILKRSTPPKGLLACFDLLAPAIAGLESVVHPPCGLSLICIARRRSIGPAELAARSSRPSDWLAVGR